MSFILSVNWKKKGRTRKKENSTFDIYGARGEQRCAGKTQPFLKEAFWKVNAKSISPRVIIERK